MTLIDSLCWAGGSSQPMRTAPDRPSRSGELVRLLLAITVFCASMLVGGMPPVHAEGDDDLDQTLAEDEVVTGERTITSGHLDLGPKFAPDGSWRVMIHEDADGDGGDGTSVWRDADETVVMVPDSARMPVPDDDAYGFLDVPPGTEVHVLPQTQDTALPWLGWNTQDPEVLERLDRGATFSVTGVRGPGDVAVFLQSGSFGEPEVLWDTTRRTPQSTWVDVNTHTHANWVFTQPGVYLLEITVQASLVDGTQVTDTAHLRFAVGDQTSDQDALRTVWDEASSWGDPPSAASRSPIADEEPSGASSGPSSAVIAVLAAAVFAAVVSAGLVLRARARRDRTEAFGSRATGGDGAGDTRSGGPPPTDHARTAHERDDP